MAKKMGKRALSVLLCLVLIATTFFIFDPSILIKDADAYVNVEGNKAVSSLSGQIAYAPEAIYLKPGSSAFQYFMNYSYSSGRVAEIKSTSSTLKFENKDATEVQLAVNKVYYKNGTADVAVTSSNLKLNNTTVSAVANCTATSTAYGATPTVIASGTTGISYTLTSGSLSNYVAGRTYFIQWVVRYKIDGNYHFMFMYTGIYAPSLNMTAVAGNSFYSPSGGRVRLRSFAFVTGAMKYSEKGNRYNAFTGNTVRAWGTDTGAGTRTAPLISFVGYKNSTTANTIPNEDYDSTNNFPTTDTGSGKTVFVMPTRSENKWPNYYTNFTSYGSFANPNPTGTISADCKDSNGALTGVAYMVVDTSRFSNYNQIPNLSAGYVSTYKEKGKHSSSLEWIVGKTTTLGDMTESITCSPDTSKYDEDGQFSRAYGLYKINGAIYSGGFQLAFRYKQYSRIAFGVDNDGINQTTAIGIHTTVINKTSLRETYNNALISHIDKWYVDNSKTALSTMNYTDYYNQLKTTGEALCDPTAYSMNANSTLEGYVTAWSKAIDSAFDSSMYFYVPETIYINPIVSSSKYNFQYYVDRAATADSVLDTSYNKTTGNVFFSCAKASNVSITASINGGSVTLGQSSATNGLIKTTMSGYANTYSDKTIEWTATYTNTATGRQMTTKAYTYCYAPLKATNGTTVISASAQAGYKSRTHTDTNIGITGWIVGAHTVDAKAYTISSVSSGTADNGSPGAGRGGYKNNYLEAPSTVPTNGRDDIQGLYNTYYGGGSGFWEKDANVNYTTGGKGTLYVDSSRYTNLGQIPDLYVGIDCNQKDSKTSNMRLYYDWYSNGSNKNPTTYTAASQDGVETGSAQRGKKLTSASFSSKATNTNTLVLHAWADNSAHSYRTAQATCYLVVNFRDKSILRKAYELMESNANYLQQDYFTPTAWNNFTTYRGYILNYLCNPKSTASQADLNTYGKNLYNQIAKMVACITAAPGSTTATYKTYDGASTTVNRADVLKTGTARVYHRYLNGSGSTATSTALNVGDNGTNVETKTYYYGETVKTGYNETSEYDYFGYFRNEGETQWTSPNNGSLVGNDSGPDMYGTSGHNTDELVAVPNLTYTYVYHKKTVSLCKDYNGSPQDFGLVTNLANLAGANANVSYAGWGASGGTANVSDKTATGFKFSVTNAGTKTTGFRYNDLLFNGVAKNLTAGKTYTVSFKSNLTYDEKHWFGLDFTSSNGWNAWEDYAYESGKLQLWVGYTNGSGIAGTKAFAKVETSFSDGGTIGSFTLPDGASDISLLFRVISDANGTRYTGEISDIKIAEGQYVYEGLDGDSVTLDAPTWVGHTFQNWEEETSPFDGTLSGSQNRNFKFGSGDDVVRAIWKTNEYDVMFENELDFDAVDWNTAGQGNSTFEIDREANTIKAIAGGDNCFMSPPTVSMHLIPGHTYRITYNCTNTAKSRLTVLTSASPNSGFGAHAGSSESPASGETFTVNASYPYVILRPGILNSAAGDTITYSDIYIRDITNPAGATDNVSEPTVGGTAVHGASVKYGYPIGSADILGGSLPTISRTGYTFEGWYTSQDSYGNGTGTKYTANNVMGAANVKLYARWLVGVTYNTNGGSYENKGGTIYTAKNRTNLSVATSVAVSNRIDQGGTNWNSADLANSIVPYKVGYNFKGWKAVSADPEVNGKIYFPGQTVSVKANIEFVAQWDACVTASLDTQYNVGTKQGGYTFYPGQIYFYEFTPNRNMYVTGYTNVGASAGVDPFLHYWVGDNLTASNDKYSTAYGLSDMTANVKNAAITKDQTAGTYYYGITQAALNAGSTKTIGFKLVEHTVAYTLNANGGSVSPTSAKGYYNTATSLPTPSRTGWTFAGWKANDNNNSYTDSVSAADNSSRITGNTSSVTKAVTLTAQWNINQYTLNVYAQFNKASSATAKTSTYERGTTGGTVKITSSGTAGASATTKINYQSTTTMVATPATGYTFGGWYASPTLSGTTVTAWGTQFASTATATTSAMGTGGLNYYAKFEINTYTIGVYAYNNSAAAPGTFTNGTTGGSVGFASSAGSKGTTRTNVHGQSVTIYAKPNTGYTFAGWYYGNTSSMSSAASIAVGSCTLSGGVYSYSWTTTDSRSYSAKFTINQYTLTINPNGGSYGGTTNNSTVTQYYGTTYSVADPTRTGYTFKNWTIAKTGGGTATGSISNKVYTFGAGNDTITAQWSVNNYGITVDPNGGTVSNMQYYNAANGAASGTLTSSGSFTASKTFQMAYNTTATITAPTRTGYTFTGWTKTAGNGTLTNGSPVTTANSSFKVTNSTATIKANWQVNQYTLTVKAYSNTAAAPGTFANNVTGGTVKIGSGAAGATETANINFGSTAQMTATAATGYTFKGWQTTVPTSANGSSFYSRSNPATTETMGTGGLTYYARFEINSYTVTVSAAYNTAAAPGTYTTGTTGGTVSGGGSKYYGTQASLSASANTGYQFIGWFESLTATSAKSTANPYTPTITANLTLIAKFSIKQYTVSVKAYGNSAAALNSYTEGVGGTVSGAGKVYYNQKASLTASAKTGYTFGGWYTSSNVSGTPVATGTTYSPAITGDVTYYAKFSVKSSKVNIYAYGNSGADQSKFTLGVGGNVNTDGTETTTSTSKEFYYGAVYTVRAYPATGYAFGGWYRDAALTTEATDNVSETGGLYSDYYYRRFIKQDATESVYAKFVVQSYTLTVYAYSNTGSALGTYQNNATGGTVKINSSGVVSGISGNNMLKATAKVVFAQAASITATAKTGYSFGGWYATSNLSGTAISASATITLPAMGVDGIERYAKFNVGSFKINFNANGGTAGTTTSGTAYYNTPFDIPASANPSRTGFAFLGWSTSSTATAAEYQSGTSIPAATINSWYNTDKTLYAVWKATSFNVNIYSAYDELTHQGDYLIGTVGGTATIASSSINAYDNLQSKMTTTPKTGYKVDQWRYSQGAVPSQGNSISINWGTQGNSETQMPTYAINIVVYFRLSEFNINVYAYSNTAAATGTYTNNAAGGTVRFGQTGTQGASAQTTGTYGTTVLAIAAPATGYKFDAWYSDATLKTQAGTSTSLTATIGDTTANANANKYYAKFSIVAYTAKGSARYYSQGFDYATGAGYIGTDGGTVKLSNNNSTWSTASGNQKASVNAYYTATIYYVATANTGYEFIGWYAGDDADIFTAPTLSTTAAYTTTMPAEDIDIHAKFTPYNFILELHPNGGTSGTTVVITLTYNQDTKIPADGTPTRLGYAFEGWSDTQTGAVNKTYNGTIAYTVVNSWFSTTDTYNSKKTVYAVWSEALYTITLDHQNNGGTTSITAKIGSALPATDVPKYAGFVFGGYFTGTGGEGIQYYDASGNGTRNWDIQGETTLYAKWTCPVLSDVKYENGKWTYIYEAESGTATKTSDTAITDKSGITSNAPSSAKEITSIEDTKTSYVTEQASYAKDINLNHYTQLALNDLRNSVLATNTAKKLSALTQPQLNEYVAKMAKNMTLALSENKKDEKQEPSIKVYETNSKLAKIKGDTILSAADSANGSTYKYPTTASAANYAFAGKWSSKANAAVDYYLYTNSATPVIALEIDDGAVGTTVANNNSSYPTNAIVTDNSAGLSYVGPTASSDNKTYTTSAVKATDDITTAWFYSYTQAGIGTKYDYNAKTIIYLTPTFSSSGTTNEIVYTITPTDDAYTVNEGVASATLADATAALQTRYSSYNYSVNDKDQIQVCICYHNSMNGTSDEGSEAGGAYLQLKPDQVDMDTWLNQMHLFRTAGGASNWELPQTSEAVYPVDDSTYASTGYVLGSFMYVFDSTNEPEATAYAEAGNQQAAKQAIIDSVKKNPSEVQAAVSSKSHSMNINSTGTGLGYAKIDGWSVNFYPKKGAYVYGHLVDRWGNVFNKVWKCFNVDSTKSTVTGGTNSVYNVFEDGGSNLDVMSLDCANIEFVTGLDSSFENGVFTTSGGSFTVATGTANKTYDITVTDHAGNKTAAKVKSDANGNVTFNVEDTSANLALGAYSFDFNGYTVNLYARDPALVRDASITATSVLGGDTVITVVTASDAFKVQLVYNGTTATYTKFNGNVTVTENEDGTLTWRIVRKQSLGTYSFGIRARGAKGWEDSDFVVTTQIVKRADPVVTALISAEDATAVIGNRPKVKVKVKEGTQSIRFIDENGDTVTIAKDSALATTVSVVDGVETWYASLPSSGKELTRTYSVIARYNYKWQKDNAKTVSTTFVKVDEPVQIYSVTLNSDEVKVCEFAEFEFITSGKINKICLVRENGDTATYSADNAIVKELADGTKEWKINLKFYKRGTASLDFKVKTSSGWSDTANYGTVEVK